MRKGVFSVVLVAVGSAIGWRTEEKRAVREREGRIEVTYFAAGEEKNFGSRFSDFSGGPLGASR